MRTLLFIAYYLPPMGSSGVQRPLKMLRYLPRFGWKPVVLAPETGLYHTLDPSLGEEFDALGLDIYRVPGNTPFHRGGGDARQAKPIPESVARPLRWLSAFRYLPDNKIGWTGPALEVAREIVRRHRPEMVLATSPPPSNLMLAAHISKEHRIPAVFDLRDDWVGNHQQIYPTPWHRRRMQELESEAMAAASAVVAVNDTIREAVKGRNPASQASFHTVPNGFDAHDFDAGAKSTLSVDGKFRLLYSGRFYGENQPDVFLEGVSILLETEPTWRQKLLLSFQGGLEPRHHRQIRSMGLGELCEDLGYQPHRTAVANVCHADLLWLVAAHRNRGEQVSTGKLFEYMASGKPVLALAPGEGEIGRLLKNYGPGAAVPAHDAMEVAKALRALISAAMEGNLPRPDEDFVNQFSRESLTGKLAHILEMAASGPSQR